MKYLPMRSLRTLLACALFALVSMALPVSAQHQGVVDDETLNYGGGSVKTYSNLSDALAGTRFLSTSAFPTRDISLYMVKSSSYYSYHGASAPNTAIAVTNWYSGSPNSNPNNTNTGFVQLYDTDGGSVYDMAMSWINPGRTAFSMSASGSNTITGCSSFPTQDCGRMWDGGSSANGGSFLQWSMSLTASGLAPATLNITTGMWESHSRPTSVTGEFSGIFYDATTHLYTVFDAPIDNSDSWAFKNGYSGTGNNAPLYGAADTADPVPEPATMSLLAIGLVGMAGVNLRRRKKYELA